MGKSRRAMNAAVLWVRRQPPKVKVLLSVAAVMAALVFVRLIVHDHDNLFIAAEAAHDLGISVLIYKLTKEKTCAGLSLKSQELTALFIAVRLYCSFVMEYDIHTILDTATLVTTLWVIYMMRFKLKSTYMEDQDNFPKHYVVWSCLALALFVHPSSLHFILNRFCWAFCVYLESVSVLPQLRLMHNTQIVEPFTSHYIFALGVARFLSCAHWVLQTLLSRELNGETEMNMNSGNLNTNQLNQRSFVAILVYHILQVWDTRGRLLIALGIGLWPAMVLICEAVQTFILADFCYYYVKSLVGGHLLVRLPTGVV